MVRTRTYEDTILNIPEGSVRCGRGQAPRGNASPPPPHPLVSLEQLLVTQNDLMRFSWKMRHVVGLTASNLDTKTEIPHTRISW
jgi:hypothetical protein